MSESNAPGNAKRLAEASADRAAAEVALREARRAEEEAIRMALADGMTAYRAAQVTGLSQTHIGRVKTRSLR